jgi:IclR family acetate operon transcriptional repressor
MVKRPAAKPTRRESPRSAVRILQILGHLGDRTEGWSLSNLSREMGTPKSSLLVLLRALTENGHIQSTNGIYRLDQASFRLASSILSARRFPEVARPILQQVVDETGETAVIGVLSEDGVSTTYIDKIESPNALRFSANIGDRRPLYASASGLVILAFGDRRQSESYLKTVTFKPLTPFTIKTKQELRRAIEGARQEGVVISKDQATQGVTGFGAPIFDDSGNLIASLILGAPTARIEGRTAEIGALAKRAAERISAVMGYSVPQGH